jgi:hypothetical protein
VSSAVIATAVMLAGAKWTPARSAATAALATAAAPAPPAAVPPAPAPARASTAPRPKARPSSDRCTAARQAVESSGDHLGPGYEFSCPASDYSRWGATTLAPCGPCVVEINTAAIGSSDAVLRYVIAHEFCHSNGIRDELSADLCAARYGFPNIYFQR